MKKNYTKIFLSAILIAIVGVWGVDFFSHLLFSSPMETLPYFWTKTTLYAVFSFIFLSVFGTNNNEFVKVLIAGIAVSLIWGAYYNILPMYFNYYPFGLQLYGLSFLGMGLVGTGLAFGVVHTAAFVVGYYVSKFVMRS